MAKTVFDVLKEKLTEQKRSSEEFIQSGAAKDFAEGADNGRPTTCGWV